MGNAKENMDEIKAILNKLKGKNDRIKYLEEQIKKMKDKNAKNASIKLLRDIKTEKSEKSLEEKVELPNNKNEISSSNIVKKPVVQEDVSDVFGMVKYQRKAAMQQPVQLRRVMQEKDEKTEKPYASTSKYGSGTEYKTSLSIYEAGIGGRLQEIEDTFIKEGLLTIGKAPSRDQVEAVRDKLRGLNPSWSEDRLMAYEKKILADVKERKNTYVARIQ